MIKLTDTIWIGDSQDEGYADIYSEQIGAILNVAHDMHATRGWMHGIEYAQVGLIDGPGNHPSAYHAAILSLAYLLKRHKAVLVCCHGMGRALSVVLMYLRLVSGRSMAEWLESLRERVEQKLPEPHEAHKLAYNRINWRLLLGATEG